MDEKYNSHIKPPAGIKRGDSWPEKIILPWQIDNFVMNRLEFYGCIGCEDKVGTAERAIDAVFEFLGIEIERQPAPGAPKKD